MSTRTELVAFKIMAASKEAIDQAVKILDTAYRLSRVSRVQGSDGALWLYVDALAEVEEGEL